MENIINGLNNLQNIDLAGKPDFSSKYKKRTDVLEESALEELVRQNPKLKIYKGVGPFDQRNRVETEVHFGACAMAE